MLGAPERHSAVSVAGTHSLKKKKKKKVLLRPRNIHVHTVIESQNSQIHRYSKPKNSFNYYLSYKGKIHARYH